MEFDIPDSVNWHTISMTTHHFDVVPGDSVYGQLALMDWGLDRYRVDIDYFKVDIVNVDSIDSDHGAQVPYHPPIMDPATFAYHIPINQDGMIDIEYPDMNFNDWFSVDNAGRTILLTVSGTQFVIMRWDLSAYVGKKVVGSGLLELTTYSLQRSSAHVKDFGMVRIVEIIGGDPDWNQKDVTCTKFYQGQPSNVVFNQQMIIDIDVSEKRGNRNLATIPNPVLERMAIKPLGAVNASFYAMENLSGSLGAKLHLNLVSDSMNTTKLGH
jgi:hypothetical protein